LRAPPEPSDDRIEFLDCGGEALDVEEERCAAVYEVLENRSGF
jgi:hypothetical protein